MAIVSTPTKITSGAPTDRALFQQTEIWKRTGLMGCLCPGCLLDLDPRTGAWFRGFPYHPGCAPREGVVDIEIDLGDLF